LLKAGTKVKERKLRMRASMAEQQAGHLKVNEERDSEEQCTRGEPLDKQRQILRRKCR